MQHKWHSPIFLKFAAPKRNGSRLPTEAFPLSAVDANALELLADQLVAETLRTHDDFVAQGRIVDLMRWKMVKERNNMTAYRNWKRSSSRFRRERIQSDETEAVVTSPQMPSFFPATDKKLEYALSETYPSVTFLGDDSEDEFLDEFSYVDVLEQNVMEKARPERVPMVFCTGVVPGTVEDAAFGFLEDTEARSRTRNASIKDVVVDDMRILARIHGPTQDDPFRFLGVKWCCHSTAGPAGRFVKPRDYLIIESTGIALDSDGERFSYALNHSIVLDEVPNFRKFGNLRMTFSACHIMRPHQTAGAIEIFCRGFMDTAGNIAERLCTYMFCEGLMGVPQTVEESYARKLLWLYHTRRRGDRSLSLASLQVSDACPCCHEKLHTGFAKLLEGNSMCQLCRQTICRKCTVKKALPLHIGGPKQLKMKTLDFCLGCYLQAKDLSAWQVAMARMPE
ncbi:START-like domain [Phytophthora cinnamomi]|uniref:START-like domain n=1 Tax=Phytophthora cinnamomi TaxID=4785 RepID=UPI003559A1A5|nr:START-like domain [Phytophthora cinnamomi]